MIAAALLVGGGDNALGAIQAGVITMAVPFSLVLLLACLCLSLGLWSENRARITGSEKKILKNFFSDPVYGFYNNAGLIMV